MIDKDIAKINVSMAECKKDIKHINVKMIELVSTTNELSKSMNTMMNQMSVLTINVNSLAKQSENHESRIMKLEQTPMENMTYWKRLLVGTIFTTSIGAIVGVMMTFLIKA